MTTGDIEDNKETERQKAVATAAAVSGSGVRRTVDSLSGAGRHPRRLIFAPGDVEAPPSSTAAPSTSTTASTTGATMTPSVSDTNTTTTSPLRNSAVPNPDTDTDLLPRSTSTSAAIPVSDSTSTPGPGSGTSTPSANAAVVAHPSRAHQFLTNPPLTFAQLDPTSPLHQFHAWFRDARLLPSLAPETCTLATAALPSGRVSARVVYLKELDERGWVVYSNWGSRAGKGGQVFGKEGRKGSKGGDGEAGASNDELGGDDDDGDDGLLQGNRWAALTFHWPTVERQVRIEGLVEPLRTEESETYWRVRERGSQLGAWASQQSQVLWSTEPCESCSAGADGTSLSASASDTTNAVTAANSNPGRDNNNSNDDGRSVLDSRVEEMEKRFANTEEIPLPPFWGGVRLVPESVEFWQGRKSRLHDRFRYVRVHTSEESAGEKSFRWRIERLSP